MEIFSPRLRRLIGHSIGSFIFAVMFMALAVALTYVEDWCRTEKRPEWLLIGFETVSIALFLTDAIVIFTICIKLVIESVKDIFKDGDESH